MYDDVPYQRWHANSLIYLLSGKSIGSYLHPKSWKRDMSTHTNEEHFLLPSLRKHPEWEKFFHPRTSSDSHLQHESCLVVSAFPHCLAVLLHPPDPQSLCQPITCRILPLQKWRLFPLVWFSSKALHDWYTVLPRSMKEVPEYICIRIQKSRNEFGLLCHFPSRTASFALLSVWDIWKDFDFHAAPYIFLYESLATNQEFLSPHSQWSKKLLKHSIAGEDQLSLALEWRLLELPTVLGLKTGRQIKRFVFFSSLCAKIPSVHVWVRAQRCTAYSTKVSRFVLAR